MVNVYTTSTQVLGATEKLCRLNIDDFWVILRLVEPKQLVIGIITQAGGRIVASLLAEWRMGFFHGTAVLVPVSYIWARPSFTRGRLMNEVGYATKKKYRYCTGFVHRALFR